MHLISFGGPVVEHSYAMNTHACKRLFCNCIFVLVEGWNSGYNHMDSCMCQTGSETLAIFMYY